MNQVTILSPLEAARDARDPDEVVPLWPVQPPDGETVHITEVVQDRPAPPMLRDRAVSFVRNPAMHVFRPARPNRAAIVIAPGGSYGRVVRDKEGFETARYFASRGYTCFVMTYRLPGDGWPAGPDVALQDAQRAVRIVRARAQDWAIDPEKIVFQGFSAGGHVAASLLTRFQERLYRPVDASDQVEARPSLVCLMYPVIATRGPFAHAASVRALFGPAGPDAKGHLGVESRVRAGLPPVFIAHAQDDAAVPVENAMMMFSALRAAGSPAELHVFQDGGHGFGMRGIEGRTCAAWPELFLTWMARKGLA